MVLAKIERGLQSNGRPPTSAEKTEINLDADVAKSSSNGDVNAAAIVLSSQSSDKVILPGKVLKELYQCYSIKQRRAGLTWFLVSSILFDIWSLIVPLGQSRECYAMTVAILVINISFCLKLCFHSNFLSLLPDKWKKSCHEALEVSSHTTWFITVFHLFSYLLLQKSFSQRDVLGWIILLHFLIYVTLPNPLIFAGIIIGLLTFTAYIVIMFYLATKDAMFLQQLAMSVLLIATAVFIGLFNYFLGEAKQRRAFLEAKKSLEVKLIIEEQSAEQERLLLSVLPKHVAEKMRQDLGSTSSEPFKKIYMSRHENVSILYADIVGFTAISSTYSAQDLVKMLNELFARFDRLAEKYEQLRIKILGDCYYCISGAPVEKPDHAVLCVHMGLSMVKAIKYVQKKTKSPVDMRVGIHTGAVLAGILGQRQWQFDVYSKDVELANKMESSGKAGRVHISNKTLSFLNGEFEVEPALGERREEALRIAGLKTYFISKVLIPFSPKTSQQQHNGILSDDEECLDEIVSKTKDDSQKCANSTELDKQEAFRKRLQHELVARDGHGELSKDTTIFLSFKNADLEAAYQHHREPYSSLPLTAAHLVQLVICLYYRFILPKSIKFIGLAVGIYIGMTFEIVIIIAECFPRIFSEGFVRLSKRLNDIYILRVLSAISIIILIGLWHFISMIVFGVQIKEDVVRPRNNSNNSTSLLLIDLVDFDSPFILYPSYLSHFGILILISISVIAQLTHIVKIIAMLSFAGLYCYGNVFLLKEAYTMEQYLADDPIIPVRYSASGLLLVAAVALSFLARHMDREDRVIFKWKAEVAQQKEMATDIRQRNEALVYNVLPMHVAEHFMKNTKRSHDDLYSQSYSEVGVLFASMPNFSDFYTEESVNNQGLECLRFLNEVISDFDALLELPQFHDIIKIKTIGSTYMAASGINLTHKVDSKDPNTARWAHLDQLVEFALELKKALQGINEQSFNHFVLKMGVNHGPITAGVIGARKPHYDIWGNTVNVASRMESTGKAGAIQVTEETCNILKDFGYTFEQRGLVSVKGKGELMTYYLKGKKDIWPGERNTKCLINNEQKEETTLTVISEESGTHNVIASVSENNGSNGVMPENESTSPLLKMNQNSTNLESTEFSHSEEDSLIRKN